LSEKGNYYPLLKHLLEEERFSPELQKIEFEPGRLIMQYGEISQRFYVIVSGQARVYIEKETKVELAILSPGMFFGEMSCLTGDPVSAHVEAIDALQTVTVSRTGMLLLMDTSHDFRSQVIEAMIKRIQNSNTRVLEEHTKSLAIMKLQESEQQERYGELIGESDAMGKLMQQITQLAESRDHVLIVGEAGTGKRSVARKLHYEATKGHFPLLTISPAELETAEWETKIQAAKQGTIIVENADNCEPHQLEHMMRLADQAQTRMLMTVRKPMQLTTAAILKVPALRERVEDIPLLANYFLNKEHGSSAAKGFDRIAPDALRMLALFPYLSQNVEELHNMVQEAYVRSEGRVIHSHHLRFGRARKAGDRPTIGLALGSGATRGMAHLGVIRILEQEGIPIDMISGTSVGSLVGGAYAAGMSITDCIKVLSTISWGQLVRPTLPVRSLFHNRPIVDFIERHVGKHLIEDLPIPFGAIASDVTTGEAHIMRSGSLAQAICASTAVPVAMRPVLHQGKRLSDGAIVHPVPAALVRSMGADIVIAVNVCPESYTKGAAKHLIDSLMNTIDIMSAKLVKEELQLADVILRPELGFSQLSFKDADNYIAAGERVTRDAIAMIRQKIQ